MQVFPQLAFLAERGLLTGHAQQGGELNTSPQPVTALCSSTEQSYAPPLACGLQLIYSAVSLQQGYDVKCGGTVKMLIDMELLAHSDYMVASDHSKWAKILQYLRYVLYGEHSPP